MGVTFTFSGLNLHETFDLKYQKTSIKGWKSENFSADVHFFSVNMGVPPKQIYGKKVKGLTINSTSSFLMVTLASSFSLEKQSLQISF